MKDDELLNLLREKKGDLGSIKALADDVGVSETFMGNVLRGRTPISRRLREYLGYKMVCKLEKINE